MGKGKPENDPLYRALRDLTLGHGVYRDDLYEVLGSELRARFGVGADPGADTLRDDVIQQLERLLGGYVNGEYHQLAKLAFNIDATVPATVRWPRGQSGSLEQIRDARLRSRYTETSKPWKIRTAQLYLGRHVLVPMVEGMHNEKREHSKVSVTVSIFAWLQGAMKRGRNLHARRATLLAILATVVVSVPVTFFVTSRFVARSYLGSDSSHPMSVEVDYTRDGTIPAGWTYLFPQKLNLSPSDLAYLNSIVGDAGAYQSWAWARHGADPEETRIRLVLGNGTDRPLSLTDLQIVKHCDAPATGTLLFIPGGSPASPKPFAGISIPDPDPAADMYFFLDDSFSVAEKYFTKKGGGYFAAWNVHYFGPDNSAIRIDAGKTRTLTIDVSSGHRYCQFGFSAHVRAATGEQVVEYIDNHGVPFRVSGFPPPYVDGLYAGFGQIYAGGAADARPPYNQKLIEVNPKAFGGEVR